MRIGQNPAKAGIKAPRPKRLGIFTVTYVPNQEGYFTESLQIIKIVLTALRQHTSESFDLCVFDNGSCVEVQQELIRLNQVGVIDTLTLSHQNIGKMGAMNWQIAAMRNEWIVFTDSDFYFRKGWLEESLRLAESFPAAALITAQPNIFDQLEGTSQVALHLDKFGLKTSIEKLDRDVIEDYCRGIGASAENTQKFLALDSLIVANPVTQVKAVYGACTAQFFGRREHLQQFFPTADEYLIAREEDNEISRRVDALDLLQISTLRPFVVHIGNHLDEHILTEIKADGLDTPAVLRTNESIQHKASSAWRFLARLNRIPFMRKVLKRLYVNLFELYSIEKK
jgi:glycosyltransferase involved in cell wall biosynthesis